MYLCENVCVYVSDSVRVSAAGTGLVCSVTVAQARACVCGGDVTLYPYAGIQVRERRCQCVHACACVLVC